MDLNYFKDHFRKRPLLTVDALEMKDKPEMVLFYLLQ